MYTKFWGTCCQDQHLCRMVRKQSWAKGEAELSAVTNALGLALRLEWPFRYILSWGKGTWPSPNLGGHLALQRKKDLVQ